MNLNLEALTVRLSKPPTDPIKVVNAKEIRRGHLKGTGVTETSK